MFLSPAQIRQLTGLREKGQQIAWLERNGIRHWVNAVGRPVVPCSAIDGGKAEACGWSPDFSKVRHNA